MQRVTGKSDAPTAHLAERPPGGERTSAESPVTTQRHTVRGRSMSPTADLPYTHTTKNSIPTVWGALCAGLEGKDPVPSWIAGWTTEVQLTLGCFCTPSRACLNNCRALEAHGAQDPALPDLITPGTQSFGRVQALDAGVLPPGLDPDWDLPSAARTTRRTPNARRLRCSVTLHACISNHTRSVDARATTLTVSPVGDPSAAQVRIQSTVKRLLHSPSPSCDALLDSGPHGGWTHVQACTTRLGAG